jgi:molybdopterin synthase sulfur carrier subunit
MQMQMTIKVFGQLTEITGENIEVDVLTDTHNLRKLLEEKYPSLQGRKYAIAVDQKLINNNQQLTVNSSVALLPPFSGG